MHACVTCRVCEVHHIYAYQEEDRAARMQRRAALRAEPVMHSTRAALRAELLLTDEMAEWCSGAHASDTEAADELIDTEADVAAMDGPEDVVCPANITCVGLPMEFFVGDWLPLQKQLWRQQCSNEPHASDGVDRAQISALMRELKMSPLSLSTRARSP